MPATQGGKIYPFNGIPGLGVDRGITSSGFTIMSADNGDGNTASPNPGNAEQSSMSPIWYFLLIVAIVVVLKWLIEHEKSKVQPAIVGISVYNWLAITLMAILGIVGFKVIVNKFQIPGLQTLVNTV